jgi:hypothetical protein
VGIPGSVRPITTRWNQRQNTTGHDLSARFSSAPVRWRFGWRWLVDALEKSIHAAGYV